MSGVGQGVAAALSPLSGSQADVSAVVDQTTDRQRPVPTYVPAHRLLSLAEVASYLAVTVEAVEELVAARSLRALRIGRELRVRPEELEAFLLRSEA